MRAIEFRYVVKFVQRMKNGTIISEEIKSNIFNIETIEDDGLDESLTVWLKSELGTGYNTCEILARQQYTGINDTSGQKIYEGDIVADETGEVLYEVVFYNASFGCKASWGSIWPISSFGLGLTIKNNIHENLLTQGEYHESN